MNDVATTDPEFLKTVESWFSNQSEIVVLILFAYAAGKVEFGFFPSFQSFRDGISQLSPRTKIIVYKEPQLPIRGIVDAEFIEKCLSEIPEASEYAVVETVRKAAGSHSWQTNNFCESRAALQGELEGCPGVHVAVGVSPWLADDENIISAIVPDEDGVVRPGAY